VISEMTINRANLHELISAELDEPVAPEIDALGRRLRRKRQGVQAILFYGAGLWKCAQADTVLDFYILIDGYRTFDPRLSHAVFGSLLPPNVYYLEHDNLRCKYAVIRRDQFERAAAGRTLTSQVWARFAQPCRLLYARDQAARRAVVAALSESVITFHAQALPLVGGEPQARRLWTAGLQQTYANEWRSEGVDRPERIFSASADALSARSNLVLPHCRPATRVMTRGARRVLAKAVYFTQLVKAVFTFDGGVDYALWKVERQSGVRLQASDFQRRHPLLGAWPLVWKAWRAGGLR